MKFTRAFCEGSKAWLRTHSSMSMLGLSRAMDIYTFNGNSIESILDRLVQSQIL